MLILGIIIVGAIYLLSLVMEVGMLLGRWTDSVSIQVTIAPLQSSLARNSHVY